MRKILAAYIDKLPGSIHICCSGNFTLETLLRLNGHTGKLTGCDVSLYTCAVGSYLGNYDLRIEPTNDLLELYGEEGFNPTPIDRAAAVALALDYAQFERGKNYYQRRQMAAYHRQWNELVEGTKKRLEKKKAAVGDYEFFPMDARDRIKQIGKDDLLLTFPPTYEGGYERLYAVLETLFDWDQPDYQILTAETEFIQMVLDRDGPYMVGIESRKEDVEELLGDPVAQAPRDTGVLIYLYTNLPQVTSMVVRREIPIKTRNWKRIDEDHEITADSKIEIHRIESPEANYIRQVYIDPNMAQGQALYNYAITVDGAIIGLLMLEDRSLSVKIDGELKKSIIYLKGDFALPCERYPRLSKLNLMVAASKEIQGLLQRGAIAEYTSILTHAFTNHPQSMKYRGVFKLLRRDELKDDTKKYKLAYHKEFTKDSLDEVMRKWAKKFLPKKSKK